MKYVQIVTQMEGGGAQRVAIVLSKEFTKRKHENEVWFLYKKRPAYSSEPGVRVLLDHPPTNIMHYLLILWRLFILLSKKRPQVLITHTHYSNVMCHPIAFILAIKKRIAVHHSPIHTYPRLAQLIDKVVGSFGIYSKSVVVSNTVRDSMDNYPESYLKRIKRIYNGVSLKTTKNDIGDVRKKFGIPYDAPILVTVGRLAKVKNQEMLIKITARIPNAHLLLIGDGEERQHLKELVISQKCENRVHFIGEVNPEFVPSYLSLSDIFILPSLSEAMPMALIEAMNEGLPIVASDIPANREVLGTQDDKQVGFLADLQSVESFIDAIENIISDKKLAEDMGTIAKLRVQKFSIEGMTDGYEQFN